MTDVEVYAGEPMTAMAAWARDAKEIADMAAKLVQTSFVPQSFNGKPAEATAAILTGLEVGLKPMAALRSIVVIQGTPALTAQALRGLAQAAGHRIWVEESTSQRAVVKGIRRGDDQVQTSIWDVQRAGAANLMNKPNYRTQAQAMFVARATSELVRLIASDVVMGLAYSIEELQDDAPPVATAEPAKKPASRTAQRRPLDPQRGEAPALPAEVAAPEPDASAPEAALDPAVQDNPAAPVEDGEPDPTLSKEYEAEVLRPQQQRGLEEPPVDWDMPEDDERAATEQAERLAGSQHGFDQDGPR